MSTARPAVQAAAPRRSSARILGVTGALLALALATAWMLGVFPFAAPVASDAGASPQAPVVSTPAAPAAATKAAENPQEQQLNAARARTREQMIAGQNEQALETAIGGLAVDPRDPELNRLVDDIAGTARRIVREARAGAAARGATVKSSAAFREAQTQEREAENRLRAGDRVPGARAAWAAATLYNRAPEAGEQRSTAAAPPVPPTRGTDRSPAPPTTGNQAVPISPSFESLNNLPGRVNKPPAAPPPPSVAAKSPPPVQSDPAPDPRAAEITAVRETLRRYREAYESLDSAAVGKLMPSLTAGQLRDLGRDFANYRRYTVEIREERISVEGQTATVTGQVVRSFETRDGEKSGHTVSSTFHLRRSGSSWIIERLESH